MIRNIKLTNNHDNHITANHNAAFFKIFVHDFTFQSSLPAVSIWNHPRKQSTNATRDNIHSTRFTAVCITSNNLGSLSEPVPCHAHGTKYHDI